MEIKCLYDELVDPKTLKANPLNRNRHSPEQITRLAKIIDYQGQRAPVVVSKRSGFLAKGHGTTLSVIELGSDKIAVVYQDFESDEAEYAFVQSDNAIALWAELDLSGINADIGDFGDGFDIDLLGLNDFKMNVPEKIEAEKKEKVSRECPNCGEII